MKLLMLGFIAAMTLVSFFLVSMMILDRQNRRNSLPARRRDYYKKMRERNKREMRQILDNALVEQAKTRVQAAIVLIGYKEGVPIFVLCRPNYKPVPLTCDKDGTWKVAWSLKRMLKW